MGRNQYFALFSILLCINSTAMAGKVTVPNEFVSGEPAIAAEVNENFNAVEQEINTNYDVTADHEQRLTGAQAGVAGLTVSLNALQSLVDTLLPVGMVVPFAGEVARVPEGWRLCDGSAISRNDFRALFNVIGVAHGGGDGVSTFNLPDYRGRFLRGVDHDAARDPHRTTRAAPQAGNANGTGNSGNQVGSVQLDATRMPRSAFSIAGAGSHSHGMPTRQDDYNVSGGNGPSFGADNGTLASRHFTAQAGNHSHAILGGDAESRPVNAYVNWIIKL